MCIRDRSSGLRPRRPATLPAWRFTYAERSCCTGMHRICFAVVRAVRHTGASAGPYTEPGWTARRHDVSQRWGSEETARTQCRRGAEHLAVRMAVRTTVLFEAEWRHGAERM